MTASRTRLAVAALACGALACSRAPASPSPDASTGASVSGSVLGTPFVAADVAANTNGSPPAGTFPYLELSITDVAGGACDDTLRRRADSHVLRIYIFNELDQSAIGPGIYRDAPPNTELFTVAVWHVFGPAVDGNCVDEVYLNDATATTTLTEVSPTRVVGSFDITLASAVDAGLPDAGAGHVSGTFNAPLCPTPDGGDTTCL